MAGKMRARILCVIKFADRISIIIITIVTISIFYVNKNGLCADITQTESDYYQQDEFAGHIHRPYAKREYTWPEHPKGRIILKTNNLGFREDSDTQITKSKGTIRILVTGDSQIDGVVYNEESMPNVLEKKLNLVNQTTKFEVINGGVGYYDPDHYFLFLNKQLVLKPDAYIVVIYSGNDFLDAARLIEAGGDFNKRPEDYMEYLQKCNCEGLLDQAMNQIYYFKTFPTMKEKVVRHVFDVLLKINQLCKMHDIDFIVIFLPTKADVEWQTDSPRLGQVKECLHLDESDLKINRDLVIALMRQLSDIHVSLLDMHKAMEGHQSEFFWKKDYHLNVRGHAFLAERIYEIFGNRLASHKTKRFLNLY